MIYKNLIYSNQVVFTKYEKLKIYNLISSFNPVWTFVLLTKFLSKYFKTNIFYFRFLNDLKMRGEKNGYLKRYCKREINKLLIFYRNLKCTITMHNITIPPPSY